MEARVGIGMPLLALTAGTASWSCKLNCNNMKAFFSEPVLVKDFGILALLRKNITN